MDTAPSRETYLAATYQVSGGERWLYCEEVDPDLLKVILGDAKTLVTEGMEQGFIHPKDGA